MFIVTAKLRRIKTVLIAILLIAVVFFALLLLFKGKSAVPTFSHSTLADTSDRRIEFLNSFGWEIDKASEESQNIVIPRVFPQIYEDYNEIQKRQGCDLNDYAGLEVVRYTYTVTNYPDYTGTVYAELLVCDNVIIGGDIHAAAMDGFIRGLSFPE